MKQLLQLIGRTDELFTDDVNISEIELSRQIGESRFLVIGGAGSIGQAVVKQLFKRNPLKLHVVDISENNLVELVRDLRSSLGYIAGDFKTYALDVASAQYDSFIKSDGHYDYVLNLSALKHVRSEKDPFTLMRMVEVNILNTIKTLEQSISSGVKKYFCVSTDKAANPVNMMGGSKRIMELYLAKYSSKIDISTARFANVAFSDGSLLHGFDQRIKKRQPIVAPNDIKRYFVTPKESGELCIMSCIFGRNMEIFFPKLSENLHLITFASIAEKYLHNINLKPELMSNEDEARRFFESNHTEGKWPCLFTKSDTTGEKDFEEFFTKDERVDLERFKNLGVVTLDQHPNLQNLSLFLENIENMRKSLNWNKKDILDNFKILLPAFEHEEKDKYLDSKM